VSPARSAAAALLLALVAAGCRRAAQPPSDEASPQRLVAEGRYDQAIARLESASDAESLYLLGRAWAGRARQVGASTPARAVAGTPPAVPFQPEELHALDALERAVAARPDHAAAQLALAELLAPHALVAATARRPPAVSAGSPDATPERVVRCYGAAIQADPSGIEAAEGLVRFASAAGRLSDADAAYQELLRRRREDATLLVRYGDFLAGPRAQPEAALAQYAQALMWRPEDEATRRKMAEIHLRAASAHLARHEYALAEARLADARRATPPPGSPEAARLAEIEQALRDVRDR
jgi:tetratricopeptide (TPR) repeat protein